MASKIYDNTREYNLFSCIIHNYNATYNLFYGLNECFMFVH